MPHIPRIKYEDSSDKRFRAEGSERLTHYELACGYIMEFERKGMRLQLWREPATSVYSVRSHDHENNVRIFWKSFDNYTDAAKLYYQTKRNLERG